MKKQRLLDKSIVLDIIQKKIRNIQMNDYGTDQGITHLYSVMDEIDKLPFVLRQGQDVRIDIEPHFAKWMPCKNLSGYKCSECGARIKNKAKDNGNHNYCYHCGAIMQN